MYLLITKNKIKSKPLVGRRLVCIAEYQFLFLFLDLRDVITLWAVDGFLLPTF